MRLASPLLAARVEELVPEHERIGVLVTGELSAGFKEGTVQVSRVVGVGCL